MAVKIRLKRVGKKKQPSYRVVVADSRSPRDGRIIESIGKYAPRNDPSLLDIDPDRALDWLRQGAQPTESVQKLLEVSGIWDQFVTERPGAGTAAKKRIAHHKTALANRPAPEPEPEPEPEAAEAPAAEDAADEAPAEDSAEAGSEDADGDASRDASGDASGEEEKGASE